MDNHAESYQPDGDIADLFKTLDVFSFITILKKVRGETTGVQPQGDCVHGEKDQGGEEKPDTEYRKRMSEKEQDTKIRQHEGNSCKDYESQKRELFIDHNNVSFFVIVARV
jgi:hypothetical protein